MSLLSASNRVVFTKPPHGAFLWFNEAMSVRLIDQSSASTSYNNSTAATEIVSLTAPANSLANGGALRLLVSGSVVAPSTSSVSFTVKGAVSGSTTTLMATSSVALSSSTNARMWGIWAILYGQQTGVQFSQGGVELSSPGSGTLLPTTFQAVGGSTAGLDETLQVTMSVVAQLGTSSSGVTMTRDFALLEALGG